MPAESMEIQLKKGVLELCVLHLLNGEPTYGYDIMKTVRRHFPEVNESTVYAIMRRLHADGCAEVVLSAESGGPPRKYYHITQTGKGQLEGQLSAWRRVSGVLAAMGLQ